MAHLSLQALRAASIAQEKAEKRAEIRRKSLLILVYHYLKEEGFDRSSGLLANEAKLNTENFTVCDNVSLPSILKEYESWFTEKWERLPRFAKRVLGPRPQVKSHNCHSHSEDAPPPPRSPNPRKSPFLTRRKSLPQNGPSSNIGRAISDPNLNEDPGGGIHRPIRGFARVENNKKREEMARYLLKVPNNRRARTSPAVGGEEKKDSSKSSSDTDSEKNLAPLRGGRAPHQIIDLKSMIRDYTRLEDNIGDIGKGPRNKAVEKDEQSDAASKESGKEENEELWSDKMLRPTAALSIFTGELRDLASIIQREILVEDPGVHWSDILGVEEAKRLVKEAVVYPLKYPQLFVGRFKPWRGILLYGPPGTGKTLLAKAVATECRTTFFNISATSLVSKWRGDSEKLVRVLFEMARFHSPSTIFVDEVDALMASRQGEQEHEASRRMKTQLLVEMDGLTRANDRVFLLAASNIPWELDPAMLRRLEKRILVPLPDPVAREAMFRHHLPEVITDLEEAGQKIETNLQYEELSEGQIQFHTTMDTGPLPQSLLRSMMLYCIRSGGCIYSIENASASVGYSGSDLQIVCREAAMSCLRKVFNVLEDHSVNDADLPPLKLDKIEMEDVRNALKRTRPSQNDDKKYLEWHQKFGSA